MPDLKKMLTLEALSEALPSWLKRSTKPEYNADEIDSTLTTNQFVTASDKENWNAKGTYSKPSGGIPKSDLSSIVQTSLEKADSALQSETDPTVPSWAKQTNKPSYTQDEVPDGTTYKRVTQTEKNAWNGKQNAISTTQMQAVNSGITSEKVTQISTNQTNILYGLNTGVKNIIDFSTGEIIPSVTTHSVTWTIADNKGVVANGTSDSSGSYPSITKLTLPVGTYKMSGGTSRIKFQCGNIVDSGSGATLTVNENTTQPVSFIVYAIPNTTFSNETIYPILCTEEAWNQSHDYQPPALSNSDLTRLEAEDRAALAERIDTGVKSLVPLTWTNTDPFSDIHLTQNRDGSVIVEATNTAATRIITFGDSINYYLTVGKKYVLSGCNGGDYNTTYGFALSTSNFTGRVFEADGSTEFTYTSSDVINFTLVVRAGQTWTKTFYPMICDAPAWKLSPKYAPYSFLIKGDMWAEKYETRSTTLTSAGIKFIAPRQTIYRITATALDNGGHPTEIAIKWAILPSSTESFLTRVTKDSNSVSLTTTAIVTLGTGGYFEVYTSYENATSNRVYAIVEEVVLKPF